MAHSMGNIVTSEAIRKGMVINNYALMQAATPSACYDDDEARIKQTQSYSHLTFNMWDNATPDQDTDPYTRSLAYRGRFKNLTGNLVSFFLPIDYATFMPWEVNNDQTKPENGPLAANYHYKNDNANGKKLYKFDLVPVGAGQVAESFSYYLTDPYEAMPYACRTWGKAQGAQNSAQGSIDRNVDLRDPSFQIQFEESPGFGDEHSGQFNANIQDMKAFYNEMLRTFDISRNP
jgi:hypothetical protein